MNILNIMGVSQYQRLFSYSVFLIFFLGCKVSSDQKELYSIQKEVVGVKAGVVSAHPLATQAGLEILQKGGSAADAAIAVHFALAVVYPNAGNIGGGGFFVYRDKNGQVSALDFREKAPMAASSDMYLDSVGNPVADKSLYGSLAAGVPGSVDGMFAIYQKYSKLKDWNLLILPAIKLAESGFSLTNKEAKLLNKYKDQFVKQNGKDNPFYKDMWEAGDLLVQKDLANTLRLIAQNGREGFYSGEIARLIEEEMQRSGGLITRRDLESYNPVWRQPLTGDYRGHKIISMPPPSSGGVALLQLLEMVEPFPLKDMEFQSAAHIHLYAEAERRVFADRARYLGDPDFYNVPVSGLLDSTYIQSRMKSFQPRSASASDSITFGHMETEETTHFSIVDEDGNAVAVTTTLNGSYGSCKIVKGAGFILNNEMDDFSVKPGTPNMYGLIGYEANKIEPGKRMLSSMTPTIIEKNNQLFMIVGTPGGSTIITSVFQVITNVIDFGKSLSDAVQSPRFHHQWKPDQIKFEENAFSPSVRMLLESIGHQTKTREPIGRVEAIMADENGTYTLVADKRGDDDANGY